MKKYILTLAATLLLATPAFAQATAAGKWSADMQGQQGPMHIDLDLKLAGAKLDGTMAMGPMGTIALKDGTVAGTKVSFSATINAQGNEILIKYSGDLKGDELALTPEVAGMQAGGGAGAMPAIVFKRAK